MIAARPVAGVTEADASAMRAAIDLAQNGKFEQALAALEKLQPTGELKAHAAALRGSLLAELVRYPEAMAAFDEALAQDRLNQLALNGKTTLLLAQDRPEDALILADRLVLVAPEEGAAYRLRGSARRQTGDYKGALADWDIAIEKQAADEATYVDRLNMLYALGQRDKAVSEAAVAAARFPKSANVQAAYANMLARAGRRDEAAKAAALSLKLGPNADAYLIRVYYDFSGDDQAALKDLLAAIRLEPTRSIQEALIRKVIAVPGARKQLEAAYDAAKPADAEEARKIALGRDIVAAAAGEPDRLLAHYDEDAAKRPKEANPLNEACWARATRGTQLERALADCSAAIAITPEPAYFDSRGVVRLRLQAYADAIGDFDAALDKNANMPSSLFGRGLAKLRSGDKPGGEADLAAARKLDPRIDRQFADMGMTP
jgi:tetratricopeptide (TPR) repeat protein